MFHLLIFYLDNPYMYILIENSVKNTWILKLFDCALLGIGAVIMSIMVVTVAAIEREYDLTDS